MRAFVRFPAAFLPLLAVAGCGPPPPETSVLVLTLDTTRTDALGCYDGVGRPTPHLDRLAAEGVVFDNAFSCAPITLPAHSSLWTGLYPIRHGVRDNGMGSLPASARSLAERAEERGYRTGAFVASVVLDPAFGLDQGFERYDAEIDEGEDAHGERPAREVVDAALTWLDTVAEDEAFLLWLHFYDPHTPYEAREHAAGCGPLSAASSNRERYDREVCDMDGEIGRVLAALEDRGALDDTLILAIGDHAEAFGEHGEYGHTAHCFDTTLRVPWIVRFPDGRGAGSRRADVVSLVDVAPSLTSFLDLESIGDVDGRDVLSAPAPADRGVYFESYYGYLAFGWSPIAGWLDADGKYVHTSAPEFYDLASDPDELSNRGGDPGVELRRYQRAIAELADRPRLERADAVASDQDLLASLRGLGYIAGGAVQGDLPHPLGQHELPSPTAMIPHYERSIDALAMTQEGRFAEAVPVLQEVRAVNPRNPFVLDLLANCLMAQQRLAEAEPVLRELIEFAVTPQPAAHARLGAVLVDTGRTDEGIEELLRSHELSPGRPRLLRQLIGVLRREGRDQEAEALARELSELREARN